MFLNLGEEKASRVAEELMRKYKDEALRVSFGEPSKINRISRTLRRLAAFRIAKELYLLLALGEAVKVLKRFNFITNLMTPLERALRIATIISRLKGVHLEILIAEPVTEGLTLEFPGGMLKLIEKTKEGYLARAYPRSLINGTRLQAHILSRMLKGIYPSSYSDQGDLLWKSALLRVSRALDLLKEFEMDEGVRKELALEAALRSTKLWPILAMLMAEDFTEAYAQLGGNLIMEHVIYGRIRVDNYVFDEEDLKKLMTFIEADPNSGFEFRRSLAEVDLTLADHKFRISLDVPPSSRGALDVRNLSAMRKLSLPRLINLGVLSSEEASLILTSVEEGCPIIIFGRTGVGKTTLVNAVLATLPRDLRLISVEEVREIEDLSIYGMHHTPYEVPRGKLDFIRFLLHRNPDLVFLGEILTKEQAEAFSLAHASGLGVIATSHARSYKGLVRKWGNWGLEVPEETLAVLMERRRVVRMMKWEGAWVPAEGGSSKWLSLLEDLKGAYTNEEVGRRICELEGLLRSGR
ncbi:MAG: ATPase, T2SS/T4P/T4SS family [Candidatus Korarchaeum sp.]|nr:ATPase, T2SS/T4P/T4SS family [Candidatus Korarchaeum sp.]MDW8035231.1 ATPase, T2SS/T4P/T4SS family [Candidatus Korarchaeum sp.]